MHRTRSGRLILTSAVLSLLAVYLLWSRPEEVVVFIPSTSPFLVLLVSVFAGTEALTDLTGRWRLLFWLCLLLSTAIAAVAWPYVQLHLSLTAAMNPLIMAAEVSLLLLFPIRALTTAPFRRNAG
jgi:hypothetical protein